MKNLKILNSLILSVIVTLTACQSKDMPHDNNIEHRFLKRSSIQLKNWDEIFTQHKVFNMTFPEPTRELWDIRGVKINSRGEFFIQDAKAHLIFHFDQYGKFIRQIGSIGEGPGEYLRGGLGTFDKSDNLYVFDLVKRFFIKYSAPDYEFKEQFSIKSMIRGDVILDPNGGFIVYSLDESVNHIICKLNNSGEVVKRAFVPNDKDYIIFIQRFGLGRVNDFQKKGFIFMDPQRYHFYVFDYDLNMKRVYQPAFQTEFFPFRESFPKSLSPYQFSPNHAKWWESSCVPDEVKVMKHGVIIGMVLKYKKYTAEQYINIHDLEGNTYAVGLKVPFCGIIRYINEEYVYLVENEKLSETGEILPQRIHQYRLNDELMLNLFDSATDRLKK